jgi:hypothetical protein
MEPEDSLTSSPKPVPDLNLINAVHSVPLYCFQIQASIIHLPTLLTPPMSFGHENPACISPLPYTLHMPFPSHTF